MNRETFTTKRVSLIDDNGKPRQLERLERSEWRVTDTVLHGDIVRIRDSFGNLEEILVKLDKSIFVRDWTVIEAGPDYLIANIHDFDELPTMRPPLATLPQLAAEAINSKFDSKDIEGPGDLLVFSTTGDASWIEFSGATIWSDECDGGDEERAVRDAETLEDCIDALRTLVGRRFITLAGLGGSLAIDDKPLVKKI